jgi:hypothetical protein
VAKPTPPVAIGGLSGVAVDVGIRPGSDSLTCRFLDDGGGDVALADPGAPAAQLAFANNDSTRLILLDRGDGQTLAIVIEADSMGGWQTELAEAMTIVQSFEFTR